jgi:hypothetical protein
MSLIPVRLSSFFSDLPLVQKTQSVLIIPESHRFSKPNIVTPREKFPPRRRAHTTVHYHNWLVVFGGGNGQTALNDIWALDISDPKRLTWEEWKTKGDPPARKGYHTANLVGDKMIVFGGSDGHASFADVHVLDLGTCFLCSGGVVLMI